jgi:hypothetical protein
MNLEAYLIIFAVICIVIAIRSLSKSHYWHKRYNKAMQTAIDEQHKLKAEIQQLKISLTRT